MNNRTTVMMSAYGLCPAYMPHPSRMEWMAGYFLENSAEIAALKAGLAVIRGHFPIPAPGSELEHAWAEAIGMPERIPAYVTACIDAKDVEIAALKANQPNLAAMKFHPQASHVNPDYRDGFNHAIDQVIKTIAQAVQPS